MKNLLFAAPILLLLSACNPAAPAGTEGTSAAGAPTTAAQPSDQPATPAANARQAAPASNADLLIGKWQATDDPKAIVEFDGKQRKEAGISEAYTLGDRCTNPGNADGGTPEKDHYITVAESDMCWYIIDLSADRLSLSYMGRGNTLDYKRMK